VEKDSVPRERDFKNPATLVVGGHQAIGEVSIIDWSAIFEGIIHGKGRIPKTDVTKNVVTKIIGIIV